MCISQYHNLKRYDGWLHCCNWVNVCKLSFHKEQTRSLVPSASIFISMCQRQRHSIQMSRQKRMGQCLFTGISGWTVQWNALSKLEPSTIWSQNASLVWTTFIATPTFSVYEFHLEDHITCHCPEIQVATQNITNELIIAHLWVDKVNWHKLKTGNISHTLKKTPGSRRMLWIHRFLSWPPAGGNLNKFPLKRKLPSGLIKW